MGADKQLSKWSARLKITPLDYVTYSLSVAEDLARSEIPTLSFFHSNRMFSWAYSYPESLNFPVSLTIRTATFSSSTQCMEAEASCGSFQEFVLTDG